MVSDNVTTQWLISVVRQTDVGIAHTAMLRNQCHLYENLKENLSSAPVDSAYGESVTALCCDIKLFIFLWFFNIITFLKYEEINHTQNACFEIGMTFEMWVKKERKSTRQR